MLAFLKSFHKTIQKIAKKENFQERLYHYVNFNNLFGHTLSNEQGRKRPLDTPERMIERREREAKREKER